MKKGFTLVELLAVIVILAIIALIATPIVLSIIDDAKKSATLRSAEYYLNGVETSVSTAVLKNRVIKDGTYYILENGNICLEDYDADTKTCKDNDTKIDNNELKVEVKGEKPSSGIITIINGQIGDISLNLSNKEVVKNEKDELVYYVSPCTLISGEPNIIGSKYQCKVKDDMEEGFEDGYYFFVLSQESDGTTNLIMERNICDDGTVATSDKKCLVAWISKKDYNDDTNYGSNGNNNKGPVTAMNYLYKATKDWGNVPNIVINYTDEGSIGNYGYGTITTTDNLTKITKKDESVVIVLTDKEKYINLKARMPRYDEVHGEGKCLTYAENGNQYGSCALWLSNYLESSSYVTGEGLQNLSGIMGYWTISSFAGYSDRARNVSCHGIVGSSEVDYGGFNGVRPVINVKL